MSLAIQYESLEDARMRLKGGVVLYKGDPVYVKEIERGVGAKDIFRIYCARLPYGGTGYVEELDEEGVMRKYISSKHLDRKSVV